MWVAPGVKGPRFGPCTLQGALCPRPDRSRARRDDRMRPLQDYLMQVLRHRATCVRLNP